MFHDVCNANLPTATGIKPLLLSLPHAYDCSIESTDLHIVTCLAWATTGIAGSGKAVIVTICIKKTGKLSILVVTPLQERFLEQSTASDVVNAQEAKVVSQWTSQRKRDLRCHSFSCSSGSYRRLLIRPNHNYQDRRINIMHYKISRLTSQVSQLY